MSGEQDPAVVALLEHHVLIGRIRAVSAVRTAERCGTPLLALAQRDPSETDPGAQGLHGVCRTRDT